MFTVEINIIISLGFEAFSVDRQEQLCVRNFFLSSLISGLTLGECKSSTKTRNYYFWTINAALIWVTADAFTKHFFNMMKTESFSMVISIKMKENLVFREIFNSVPMLRDVMLVLVLVCVLCVRANTWTPSNRSA